MDTVDIRRYEMLVRVRDFGATHPDRFPSTTLGGQAFAAVSAAVADLGAHAASHASARGSTREGVTSRAVARDALLDDLEAITRTARAMSIDTPGVDDRFRVRRNGADQELITTARAFLADAAPLAARFVEHGLPDDFLAGLEQSINGLEAALGNRNAGRETTVAAAVSLDAAMDAGLTAVRRLDAIVPNILREDDAALAVWQRARRVEYRRPTKQEPSDPAPADPLGPTIPPAAASPAS